MRQCIRCAYGRYCHSLKRAQKEKENPRTRTDGNIQFWGNLYYYYGAWYQALCHPVFVCSYVMLTFRDGIPKLFGEAWYVNKSGSAVCSFPGSFAWCTRPHSFLCQPTRNNSDFNKGLIPPVDCPGIYDPFGKCGFREDHAVRLYTSPDLVTWTPASVDVFPPAVRPSGIYYRPKVIP